LTTDSQYVKQGIELWVPRWRANGWRTGRSQAGQEPGLVGTSDSGRRAASDKVALERAAIPGTPENEHVDQHARRAAAERAAKGK